MPLLRRWPLLLTASFASGLLAGLSFPPASLRAVAWFALVPLLWALARATPLVAAGCGLAFGMSYTLAVGWWLPSMIRRFFEMGAGHAVFFSVGIGAFMGLSHAIFALWVVSLRRLGRPAGPLAVAAGWGACEILRVASPISNPFFLYGYTQCDTPFIQCADLFGVWGVTMLVVAANAALAGLLEPASRPARLRTCARVAAAVVAAFVYGEWRLGRASVAGPTIDVALIQPGRTYGDDPDANQATLARYEELARADARPRPALRVFPEHALPFDARSAEPRLLASLSARGPALVGGQRMERRGAGVEFYNTVFLVEGGRVRAWHDKVALLPFAEDGRFQPDTFSHFQSGSQLRPLETSLGRVGVLVCSEGMIPWISRDLARAGAEVLVNPSNDVWFGDAIPAWVELQSISVRAIENRRALLRAGVTGYSAVIDAEGRRRVVGRWGGEATLAGYATRSVERTPYQRWGEAPVLLACLFCAADAILRRARHRGGAAERVRRFPESIP